MKQTFTIKEGMRVKHPLISQELTVVADEKGPAYTGNEFEDDEISLSHAINEYNEGRLVVVGSKEVLHTKKGTFVIEERNGKIFIEEFFEANEECDETRQVEVAQMHGDEPIDHEDAELICKAVNERQALLDSNRELIKLLELVQQFHLPAGFVKDAQTAINNAKKRQS